MLKNLSAQQIHKIGNVLVWCGVLAWSPYIILRFAGTRPSILLFLPVHLVGVIGGARLRKLGEPDNHVRPMYQSIAHTSIFLGVLMWVPYFYLRYRAPSAVEIAPFLTLHLTGVLTGVGLLLGGKLFEKVSREKQPDGSLQEAAD